MKHKRLAAAVLVAALWLTGCGGAAAPAAPAGSGAASQSAAAAAVRGAYPKARFTRSTRRLTTATRLTAVLGLRSSAARTQSLYWRRMQAFSPSQLTPRLPLPICVGSKSAA